MLLNLKAVDIAAPRAPKEGIKVKLKIKLNKAEIIINCYQTCFFIY